MRLVVIYGAPGVGKLTTAKSLAALTGFRLFHNHLSFDLAKAIFDFPSPQFKQLAEAVRLAAIEAAARARIPGMIFTFVYAAPVDDPFIRKMVAAVERHEAEVALVRLHCDAAIHERRVEAPQRKEFGKIVDVKQLREVLARWDFSQRVPLGETLEIDNSKLSAELVARRIAEHFSLPR